MTLSPMTIAQKAERALLYEAVANPKPGLVDPINSGAHSDMDIFTFIDSSVSLRGYFLAAAELGQSELQKDPVALFQQLRQVGMEAEQTMFAATNQVNTHKGAIFSLGILSAAVKFDEQDRFDLTKTVDFVKAMLVDLTQQDFEKITAKPADQLTAGEKQFLKYGRTGIRGEAEAGFPTVVEIALPFLKAAQGSTNQKFLDTFMKIVSVTEDSTFIKRAGSDERLPWLKEQVQQFFELGGSQTKAGIQFLERMNEIFIERHLSLGGSADLLVLTIFLDLMSNER